MDNFRRILQYGTKDYFESIGLVDESQVYSGQRIYGIAFKPFAPSSGNKRNGADILVKKSSDGTTAVKLRFGWNFTTVKLQRWSIVNGTGMTKNEDTEPVFGVRGKNASDTSYESIEYFIPEPELKYILGSSGQQLIFPNTSLYGNSDPMNPYYDQDFYLFMPFDYGSGIKVLNSSFGSYFIDYDAYFEIYTGYDCDGAMLFLTQPIEKD